VALKDLFKKKDKNLIIESNTPIDELLPIGSIVTLPDINYRMMIIGIKQLSIDNHEYDYIGVPYPSGLMGEDSTLLFNNDEIIEINNIGFQDSERFEFIDQLKEYLKR
jgi:hypothetical protein